MVVGVAWNGSMDDFAAFVERHDLSFVQLADLDGVVFGSFDVPVQPAYARLEPDGSFETFIGSMDEATLLAFARS